MDHILIMKSATQFQVEIPPAILPTHINGWGMHCYAKLMLRKHGLLTHWKWNEVGVVSGSKVKIASPRCLKLSISHNESRERK